MPADQHLPAIIARLESLEERVATLEQLLADANALHKSRSLPLDGCAEGEALTALVDQRKAIVRHLDLLMPKNSPRTPSSAQVRDCNSS